MNTLSIELKKEKRSGVIPVMLLVGILGSVYAYLNFIVRKESLLSLPLPPMDILLTQLYGVISVLNLFGIVVAACLMYNTEFSGNALKKMQTMPISISRMYLCKFVIGAALLFVSIALENVSLGQIGATNFPAGTFESGTVIHFAAYSFVTSMPVLPFMLFVSSLFENIWMPLGIGVVGFLSSMAFATSTSAITILHPFVILLKPAMAMSSNPDITVILFAVFETLLFLVAGLITAKYRRYE